VGNRQKQKLHVGVVVVFLLYILELSYFLFFAEMLGRKNVEPQYHYNLVLFREIRRFWVYRDVVGTNAMVLNLIGNVIAFMPFGYFVPALFRRAGHGLTVGLVSFLVSLLIECTQLICKVGSFDVDDLLLNTAGGILGYLVYWSICHLWRRRRAV
jgi:glycopeptide antibiotics resistance protein